MQKYIYLQTYPSAHLNLKGVDLPLSMSIFDYLRDLATKKTHKVPALRTQKHTDPLGVGGMIKRDIYIALAGSNKKTRQIKNDGSISESVSITQVGVLSYYEPPTITPDNISTQSTIFKNAFMATFTYCDHYEGAALDPVNLNHAHGQRVFSIPSSLKSSGIFRIFSECLPSGSGRKRMHKEFPETLHMSDIKLLSWLSDGGGQKSRSKVASGFASGALLFFTKMPGDERPHLDLDGVKEFRAKCVADLANLVTNMTDQELAASWVHGGANIKTTYYDEKGEVGPAGIHYIVKFNDLTSGNNNARVEHATLELAKLAGVRVARSIVVRIHSSGVFVADLFLTERYDRFTDSSGRDIRRHRLSLLSVMDPSKVKSQDSGDYKDIFAAIRKVSADPHGDCIEMFRRLLFNIGINNTDDHLKNHEFVYSEERNEWRLSPAFDITPNNNAYPHATAIAGYSNGTLKPHFIALIAERLGVDYDLAISIRNEVSHAIDGWKTTFKSVGCDEKDFEYVQKSVHLQGKRADDLFGPGQNIERKKSMINK